MQILNLVQGSPEWQAARQSYRCASDAPVMMGASPRCTRSELVRMAATGDQKEFSEWVQKNLLDKGHSVEAAARPLVEEMLEEDLYPVTGASDCGLFLASFDGINMIGDTGFEHKMWNEELAAAVRAKSIDLPSGHHWQLEQQILVGGLKRVIFVVSDGTPEKRVWMEYRPVPGRAKQLLDGWLQFEDDVKNYKPVDNTPAPRGCVIPDLPALVVQLTGKVTKSNLVEFRAAALDLIGRINTDLKTDQDFADAANMVKFCGEAEDKIDLTKDAALAQTKSIDELFRVLDELKETMRSKRLELDKLVEAKKKSIRSEILKEGQDAFGAHVDVLNKRLGKAYIPAIATGFAEAMKGKKTIAGLRDAVATELARQKIAVNAIGDKIGINLNALRDAGAEYAFLFADLGQIVFKETDDFGSLVKLRIAEHKAKEDKRLADERERIRQEEAAKLAVATPAPPVQSAPAPVTALNMPQPSARAAQLRGTKPTDDEIIAALAVHFNAHESRVVGWLLDMDLDAAIERVAAEPIAAARAG